MTDILLHELAHARAGDKGDTSILSVFPLDDADYGWLCEVLTVERVVEHLGEHLRGHVTRYEVPLVQGVQLVCQHALDGGVTTSLAVDTHGKALSSRLLTMRVPAPAR